MGRTLITGTHERVNVVSVNSIKYMFSVVKDVSINYYVQVLSCVSIIPFENSGCIINKDTM